MPSNVSVVRVSGSVLTYWILIYKRQWFNVYLFELTHSTSMEVMKISGKRQTLWPNLDTAFIIFLCHIKGHLRQCWMDLHVILRYPTLE